MAFSPKFLVLGALLVSLLLAGILLSVPGAQAGTLPASQATAGAGAAQGVQDSTGGQGDQVSGSGETHVSAAVRGSATLDLALLAKEHNLGEADNVRWSLVRGTPDANGLYSSQSGVEWAALRKVSAAGSISLPAGASWSFNNTYGGGPGYKVASGVLAGGQCALATAFRAAAMKAGLPAKARLHRTPIPGFPQDETANIWWGTSDLVIQNNTGQDLVMDWKLTPTAVSVTIN